MRFSKWKELITTGREVEFTYDGKRYSVTYPDENSKMPAGIYFGEFYKDCQCFQTPEEFMAGAKIGDKLLKDIRKDATDIDIF
jgi:hypothetical protein